MSRIHDLLASMAEVMSGAWWEDTPCVRDEGRAGWNKVALHVPYGLDFATWRNMERRRLERDAIVIH